MAATYSGVMSSLWHCVSVCLLLLRCSPLCCCSLAEWTSDAHDMPVQQHSMTAPHELADSSGEHEASHEHPCICAAFPKIQVAPTWSGAAISAPVFIATLVAFDQAPLFQDLADRAAVPPDTIVAHSLPRLN